MPIGAKSSPKVQHIWEPTLLHDSAGVGLPSRTRQHLRDAQHVCVGGEGRDVEVRRLVRLQHPPPDRQHELRDNGCEGTGKGSARYESMGGMLMRCGASTHQIVDTSCGNTNAGHQQVGRVCGLC
jgi:hypothetical protein